MWPAVAAIVGFAWLELVYVTADASTRRRWRRSRSAYFVVMLAGMSLFGIEQWGGQRGRVRRVLQPALAAVGARP